MPLRFRLQDLPERLRTQAEHQLAPKKGSPVPNGHSLPRQKGEEVRQPIPYAPKTIASVPVRQARAVKMTATEKRYQRDVLFGAGRFEPITLILSSGSRYTPDFLTLDDGIPTLHEVKGSYRLGSQGRAHTAFLEAASQFPFFRFVWATQKKDGSFDRSVLPPLPSPITQTGKTVN